jgi:hypothetical protein
MHPSICYLTPTYAPDIERFAVLRESIRIFSPAVPHIAMVETEDLSMFERRFRNDQNLIIRPTSSILTKSVERMRRELRSVKGNVRQRIAWRLGLKQPATGWKIQQITKIEALSTLPYEAVVFVDSDLLFCAPVAPDYYFHHGKLVLLESRAETYLDYVFEASRTILMEGGLSKGNTTESYDYNHHPVCFLSRTGRRLRDYLASRHENWHKSFLNLELPAEFNLMGYTARVLEGYEGYHLDQSAVSRWNYRATDPQHFDDCINMCRAEEAARKFIWVQSNMRLPESAWKPHLMRLITDLATVP